jgi:hypothetical protein
MNFSSWAARRRIRGGRIVGFVGWTIEATLTLGGGAA